MGTKNEKELIVGLDIGTSKVAAIVGEFEGDQLTIKGFSANPSHGLKRGIVVNIESTVDTIQKTIAEAEEMAGCDINSMFTGIAGSHIHGMNSHGVVAVEDQEVSEGDVSRVIEAARAVAIPADQKILHILPQEFLIDQQGGIKEPIGMSGVRLEAKVHMITGAVGAAQNIAKCVSHCGIQVNDIIVEQLASSYAVLGEDEKELGVCLVDIGGGTTDIVIFADGAIRHTGVIPIAGDQVTNDIAVALSIPRQNAEALKLEHGCALVSRASENTKFELASAGGQQTRTISQKALAEVIEPRYEELFELINAEIERSGFSGKLGAGIVLTGGASKVEFGLDIASRVFNRPVRLGATENVKGFEDVVNNPQHATGIGLLLYGHEQMRDKNFAGYEDGSARSGGLWTRVRNWFQGNF